MHGKAPFTLRRTQSQGNNADTSTRARARIRILHLCECCHAPPITPSLLLLLPPSSPLLPLFPDCTPTCPGPASGEIGLAGGLFSELCSFSFLLPFLFSSLFPPVFFPPCLYRCWLITGTFSLCQQCAAAAAAVERLPASHPLNDHLLLLLLFFLLLFPSSPLLLPSSVSLPLITRSEWRKRGEEEGQSTDVY